MGILVACTCGKQFDLKDELAGKRVACPDCRAPIDVPANTRAAAAGRSDIDPAFDRDKFLMRQKRIAINEKYLIYDDANQPILFVERPTFLLWSLAATFGTLLVGLVGVVLTLLAASAFGEANETLAWACGIGGLLATIFATLSASIFLFPKRHVTFWRDASRGEKLLEVRQDSKLQLIEATFTVVDPRDGPIARLSKNVFTNLFRKRWRCRTPDAAAITCTAFEDSIILALLRRFLGTMMGLLRTNFLIVDGRDANGRVLGEFNRKFTLFDRYVLDLSSDPQRTLDRRVAMALGVLLDTGERR